MGDEDETSSSPFLFSDYMFKWLENALDFGLTEHEFWEMTLAEFDRFVDSRRRVIDREAKEKATYDYILGDLIGRSVARLFDSSNKYPEIYDAYPALFDKDKIEQQKQERLDELSAQRFMAFAKSFNDKFAEKEGKDNE